MEDEEIMTGEIAMGTREGTLHWDSPQDLFETGKNLYNALVEIPQEQLSEMDKCGLEWLEIELVNAEKQLEKTGGMTARLTKNLILTTKVISGIFLEFKTEHGIQFLDELEKHILIH